MDGEFDYKQYSFSPLLLFAESGYFDKGYSNFNSVEDFFRDQIPEVNVKENVLCDRLNM